jgi:5-methylcytosine-specific restriction enzyme A
MARLKTTQPLLTVAPPRLAAPKDDAGRSAYRRKHTPGYALYSDRRWRGDDNGVGGLRWDVLVRDRFSCRMCGVMHSDTSRLEADHIKPHKGDPALFWDPGNLQCLCGDCHRGRKQADDRRQG